MLGRTRKRVYGMDCSLKMKKIIDLERGEMIANLNEKLFENIKYFCFVVLCIETANLCALG